MDSRKHFYILLEHGEFNFNSSKSIQITVTLRDNKGKIVKSVLSTGSSTCEDSYKSLVLHHNNNPKWMEQIRLDLPPNPQVNK